MSINNEIKSIVETTVAPLHNTSFLDLFLQADLVVQFVMLLLICASTISWTIIFDKMIFLSTQNRKIKQFLKIFHETKSINQLLKYTVEKRLSHPLAEILLSAVEEWKIKPKDANNPMSVGNLKDRVQQAMDIALTKASEKFESKISFLATISSSAPFIGLFGTVWGIMASFQAIAATKNTTLAVVAPGIAEALLATAFGLIAAIPAAIFYNKFIAEVDQITIKAEIFKMELGNLMLRELL